MPLAITEAQVNQILEETPFAKIYGIRLRSLAEGACTIEIPFQAAFNRPDGIINGSVYMASADIAMWFAIMTRLGRTIGAVTVEMKTAFLHSASQEDIRCQARVLKLGKRLVYGVAESTNLRGDLLAHHTLTYIRPD